MGLEFTDAGVAPAIVRRLFDCGVIIQTSSIDDTVLKLLPPLIIDIASLMKPWT
jgi:4-aminobutyrate aminotransferase-like enzyme